MEKAPFKLTEELADVMGGRFSSYFADYVKLVAQSLIVARRHCDAICTMIEIMQYHSNFPAFK
jgi:phosphatidylinositol kinase/protein kinase (PI-3  family)